MNSKSLKSVLIDSLKQNSGLEAHRPYLGMSAIGQCPRKLYFEFLQGRPPVTDRDHWYCWTGYLHESALIHLLDSTGLNSLKQEKKEIIAGFDDRFRGHIDYVLDSDLVEIKSVNYDKFQRMIENGASRPNIEQIQMYLRHGNFSKCHLVYIARDVPHNEWQALPIWTFEVLPVPGLADKLDQKAQRILAAIDQRQPPECECGWCQK